MGLLDRLLGRAPQSAQQQYGSQQGQPYGQTPYGGQPATRGGGQGAGLSSSPSDDQAIARYRYLLRTAPPDKLEQAHAEAFAQLSPEQRAQVLGQLSSDLPEHERPTSDDPQTLARAATRAELRQPGYLQRSFGGPSFGGMLGASMLGTIGGLVIGTAIADAMFGDYGSSQEAADAGESSDTAGAESGDAGDPGADGSGDAGYDTAAGPGDAGGGGDTGGGADYGGSDFGGSDFGGGGDFGGGDFGGF